MRRVLAVLAGLYLLFGGGVARGAEEAPPPSRAAERTADSAFAAVEAARLRATAQPLPESEVFVQSGHSARIARLAWSPDDRFIATASDDNTVKLWDVDGRAGWSIPTRGHGSVVNAVAFTPDGTRLVTAAARPDSSLHVIERRSGKHAAPPGRPHQRGAGLRHPARRTACPVGGR
jgi:hypothetical protein